MFRTIKVIFCSSIILLLAACNSTPETTQELDAETITAKRDEGWKCEKVAKTGSRLKTRQCSSKAERDQARADAKEMLTQAHNSTRMTEN